MDIYLIGWEQATWKPFFIACLSFVFILYIILLKKEILRGVTSKQFFFFCGGLILLGILLGSPLSEFAHFSFTTHMIQMSILYFIIPPVLLFGIPNPINFKRFLLPKMVKTVLYFISPFVALVIFSILFSIYHLPMILHAISGHSIIHNSYQIVLFLLALQMWLPIVPHDMGILRQMKLKRYTYLSGLLLMPACLLFILSGLLGGTGVGGMHNNLLADLCMDESMRASLTFPLSINNNADQVVAGIMMLGLHKFSIWGTLRL